MPRIPDFDHATPRRALPEEVTSRLAAQAVRRAVPAGTILYRRGDSADGMYVVDDGQLEIQLDDGGPARHLGPGALLGELALITPAGTRTATVVARTDCRLGFVDRARFEAFLKNEPGMACETLEHACSYLIESEQQLVADLRRRNAELEAALDYMRRTREELDAAEMRAQTDELTGLYNRRCLDRQLPKFIERALAFGEGLAVLALDLDLFKPINDELGHPAGDAVLRQVGSIIKDTSRSTDLPCRVGGDEFVVLLAPVATLGDGGSAAVALRLRSGIADRELAGPHGERLHVGVTIGGTAWTQDDDADSLLSRADAQLYDAKRAGRNRVAWEGRLLDG